MLYDAGRLLGLTCVLLWAGRGHARTSEAHISTSTFHLSDVCFSSPLLAARGPLGPWQCSSSSSTGGSATNTTTAHPSAEKEVPSSPSDEEEESSGGWTGPHACEGIYCVYANRDFAAGRGIVLISDGDTANALANLPLVVDLAGPRAADLLRPSGVNARHPGVETRDIPGKGRGLVAARPLHRGEQVLAYTPALVLHRQLVDDLGRAQQLRLLRDAVARLPGTTRTAFWRQLGPSHEDGDDDILDIVMNNSFNLPLVLPGLEGVAAARFIGNFPEVSMYNHDCRPSVAFHLDGGLIHRTHVASRGGGGGGGAGVRPGEELSISYVDSFRAREVRRARTMRNWGFACACAQCTLPAALANASDHRLWRLYEVENALLVDRNAPPRPEKKNKKKNGGKQTDGKEGGDGWSGDLDAVELLLSLYEQERLLDSHGASAYKVAALNYSAFRRRELAIKYALLALEAYIVEDGTRSEGVVDMVALLEEPEAHWSWGRKSPS